MANESLMGRVANHIPFVGLYRKARDNRKMLTDAMKAFNHPNSPNHSLSGFIDPKLKAISDSFTADLEEFFSPPVLTSTGVPLAIIFSRGVEAAGPAILSYIGLSICSLLYALTASTVSYINNTNDLILDTQIAAIDNR